MLYLRLCNNLGDRITIAMPVALRCLGDDPRYQSELRLLHWHLLFSSQLFHNCDLTHRQSSFLSPSRLCRMVKTSTQTKDDECDQRYEKVGRRTVKKSIPINILEVLSQLQRTICSPRLAHLTAG